MGPGPQRPPDPQGRAPRHKEKGLVALRPWPPLERAGLRPDEKPKRLRNGPLTPRQVTPTSNRKAWWLCPRGHSFQAVIAARTNGSDCPYCSNRKVLKGFNDLATLHPRVAAEWHPTLNGALTPEQVTPGSRKKVWWRCAFGHVWKAVIYPRTGPKKCGCPVCAGTQQRPRPPAQPTPRPPIASPHPQETK